MNFGGTLAFLPAGDAGSPEQPLSGSPEKYDITELWVYQNTARTGFWLRPKRLLLAPQEELSGGGGNSFKSYWHAGTNGSVLGQRGQNSTGYPDGSPGVRYYPISPYRIILPTTTGTWFSYGGATYTSDSDPVLLITWFGSINVELGLTNLNEEPMVITTPAPTAAPSSDLHMHPIMPRPTPPKSSLFGWWRR